MSIESYNENQEDAPKLSESEKRQMYLGCEYKVSSAKTYISTITSKNESEGDKENAINKFKILFNEGAFIGVGHDIMKIDDFCDKLKKGEYDWSYLKEFNTSTSFKEGQFIKGEEDPHSLGEGKWSRKIDRISFRPRVEGTERIDKFYGLNDIKPESVKEKEQQQFQNGMTKSNDMSYNNQKIEEAEDKKGLDERLSNSMA